MLLAPRLPNLNEREMAREPKLKAVYNRRPTEDGQTQSLPVKLAQESIPHGASLVLAPVLLDKAGGA